MTRLPFLLADLAQSVAELSPGADDPIVIKLRPKSYRAVASELSDHFNGGLVHGGNSGSNVEWCQVGTVRIQKDATR